MILELEPSDLRPEYKGWTVGQITFAMFKEDIQQTIVSIGRATYYTIGHRSCKSIRPPKDYKSTSTDPKVAAIERILNKKGAWEIHTMKEAFKRIISGDSAQATAVADQYCDENFMGFDRPPMAPTE